MRVLFKKDYRVPVKLWTEEVEPGCTEQLDNLARLPFAFRHIAAMPDIHEGYGMPIGGVFAAVGAVIPNAVGVDIGCGVRAIRTNLRVEEIRSNLRPILNQIQRAIPTGFNWHKKAQPDSIFDQAPVEIPIIAQELKNARHQIGTLGGGNHFIEIQSDVEGGVWIMLHSGSRNLGKQVADVYNRKAMELSEKLPVAIPKEWQLAYLPLDTELGQEYLRAMNFCLAFARANRQKMMGWIKEILGNFYPGLTVEKELDVHHNYAAFEEHFGQEVLVHRKGAVLAEGEVIIPGSMGSASYIAQGLANPESFRSCSHGAGRKMGRGEARRQISVETVINEMRELGVELFKAKKDDVAEECRQAYKEIDVVMENQRDLVKPLVKLQPLGVVKG